MTADPKLELLRSRLLSDQRRRLLQAAESKVLLAAGALSFVGAAEGALAALDALIRERDETGRTASVPTPALVSVPAASQASETDSAALAPTAAITGTVMWFNATKGFGFIAPDDGGPDAFVHITAVERAGIGNLHETSTRDRPTPAQAAKPRCRPCRVASEWRLQGGHRPITSSERSKSTAISWCGAPAS